MPCKDIIAYELKPLSIDMSVDQAIDILEQQDLENLPIIDANNKYLGVISYELLSETNAANIQEILTNAQLFKGAVDAKAFPYRAAKIMYESKLDILPIINDAEELVGITNKAKILDFMVDQTGIMQSGGIVILAVKSFNYSLSEIARICETNDVLILNLQIKSIPDEDEMHIILKTNSKDLSPIEAAFSRYEYNVSVIDGDFNAHSLVQERYDLLMKYLKL